MFILRQYILRVWILLLAMVTTTMAKAFHMNDYGCNNKQDIIPIGNVENIDSIDVEGYLAFLYRYMPLPDRYDYSEHFYRRNVEAAIRARREMPWGKLVPEREFRHFVLPVRVNNENLDNSRDYCYLQLRSRVNGLSMEDAILEVNHWCHEKATYRPSDARTSSPLATVRTAYGRCGEESTLLVAALRSVGIPARQVYTPRWAHTDDNHAWVEAWANGKWYFLGACEPEPVLNLGWFNESASRGMLMHTKVFGDYDGPEEVMSQTPCYTEINVVEHYAPVSQMDVIVVDEKDKPVEGALVEFKLYNYAEFYTVAQKTTDATGHTRLTAGRGDMLLWVTKDGKTAVQKVSFDGQKQVAVTLDGKPLRKYMEFDMMPPPVNATLPKVTTDQRAENNYRLAHEDSIRHAYEQTMPVEAWRGNYAVIQQFLDKAQDTVLAHRLLDVLSPKDLRDIPLEVLEDSYLVDKLSNSANNSSTRQFVHSSTDKNNSSIYDKYILNPRVENEWLTPYKSFFRQQFRSCLKTPTDLIQWCADSIQIDCEHNPQQLRMRPMSVYRSRVTDELGRKIFFVSVARSMGWPARINKVNGALQYYELGEWQDVIFDTNNQSTIIPSTTLTLHYQPVEYYDDPKYYIHFTLSKMVNGSPQLLTFPEDATWQSHFSEGVQLECAEDSVDYLLTTGTRMASGNVLATMQRITIHPDDKQHEVTFTMREDKGGIQVIGNFNAENTYCSISGDTQPKSLLSTTGRGYNVVGIIASNQEPTNHALRDICAVKDGWEKWGRKIILLFEDNGEAKRFNFAELPTLPSTVEWGIDVDGKCLKDICEQMKLKSASLPIFIVYDSFNRVVHVQQGYTINLGEQLLKVIGKL